jgi:hypothetical protein
MLASGPAEMSSPLLMGYAFGGVAAHYNDLWAACAYLAGDLESY